MLLLLAGMASLPVILIYVLVIGIFLAVLYYIIRTFFPAPIQGYAIAVVVVVAAIIIIWLLLSLVGTAPALGR